MGLKAARGLVSATLAAANSVRLSLCYRRRLGVRIRELRRYLLKSFNLAICYAALVKGRPIVGALRAGRAAFLCCAYDVASDWKGFAEGARRDFESILRELAPQWGVDLTLNLFQKDQERRLGDDGLERGVVALEFIVGMIGSAIVCSRDDVQRLGGLLQIIDDVIDLEEDRGRGEGNCLFGSRRAVHLENLIDSTYYLCETFRYSPVMRRIVTFSLQKARRLLEGELGCLNRKVRDENLLG